MVRRWSWVAVGTILLLVMGHETAQGVPAFARREGVKCTMCHFRLPELNEDGHAYIRRGLREEPPESGEMAIPADAPRALGDPLELHWARYLTVMGHHMAVAQRSRRLQLDAGVFDLWIGGPLDPHWSGLVNPSVSIEDGSIDVEQAYGQYITRWQERFVSIRAGQLLPFAILFNQGGPKMTLSTPLVLAEPAGTGNPWTPVTFVKGIEAGYVDLSRWNVYAGVGQPHLEAGGGVFDEATPAETADATDPHVAFYGSLQYVFTEEGNAITVYGYGGTYTPVAGPADRSFHRLGAFGSVYLPATKGVAGYVFGSGDDAEGTNLDDSGFFALVAQQLTARWAAYARYDWFRRDVAEGGRQTAHGPVAGVSWWAQTQVRLTVEGRLVDVTDAPQRREFAAEFMWAF